jgi:hypothetical protein
MQPWQNPPFQSSTFCTAFLSWILLCGEWMRRRRTGAAHYLSFFPTTEAEGRRELTQHGALAGRTGDGGTRAGRTVCPVWELLSCELMANQVAAAAVILLRVHKTLKWAKSQKEGRGRHSMYDSALARPPPPPFPNYQKKMYFFYPTKRIFVQKEFMWPWASIL